MLSNLLLLLIILTTEKISLSEIHLFHHISAITMSCNNASTCRNGRGATFNWHLPREAYINLQQYTEEFLKKYPRRTKGLRINKRGPQARRFRAWVNYFVAGIGPNFYGTRGSGDRGTRPSIWPADKHKYSSYFRRMIN
jgi:hypothetical protein